MFLGHLYFGTSFPNLRRHSGRSFYRSLDHLMSVEKHDKRLRAPDDTGADAGSQQLSNNIQGTAAPVTCDPTPQSCEPETAICTMETQGNCDYG